MAEITIYWYGPQRPESRQCLARCAALYAGQSPDGAQERWPVQCEERGKPFFPTAKQVYCSVSHSGDYWIGAFSRQALGVDLQEHRPIRAQALSRRFFHPAEDQYLACNGYREFYRVWTAKESFVKYSGEGISGKFSRFSVAGPQGMLPCVAGLQLRQVPFRWGYSLSLCAEEISAVTILPGR